jgi:hypothetical protein
MRKRSATIEASVRFVCGGDRVEPAPNVNGRRSAGGRCYRVRSG